MKSGLMALAIAMIELKENDALPHGTIKLWQLPAKKGTTWFRTIV